MLIPSIYCFMFMYIMSFIMVLSSEDWFLIWLSLEINMMSFILLIYRRYSLKVIECCLSYFFIQSLGSAFLISMLYNDLYEFKSMICLILSYKIGAGPFFYWFPTMCLGIDWLSCYLLMMMQKFIPLLLMFMFIHWVLWIIMLISLFMGVFGSFNQINIKGLMAYSSIHHLGWIIMVGMSNKLMWMIYLLLYGMVLLSVVILFMKNETIDLFKMYNSSDKFWFILSMMSMAGIPPLLGFYLKWMALYNIMMVSEIMLMILIMVSVLMLYIYMRVVYDVMMMGGLGNSWLNFNLYKNEFMADVVGSLGMVLGLFFGLYLYM
uniref:NADH-ubiquinone oxidoreductase chain 2 n=1 Tax=Cheliceroides longipalpis TaxID=1560386 RepID=A0A481N006_9ARAC|nr:NADH dehydrogenase subunit 2 [Cheliceroides longipalpis]QAU56479.1 NADH dehydrogenase subunit 2 [Cheliceroides longipalpis]